MKHPDTLKVIRIARVQGRRTMRSGFEEKEGGALSDAAKKGRTAKGRKEKREEKQQESKREKEMLCSPSKRACSLTKKGLG